MLQSTVEQSEGMVDEINGNENVHEAIWENIYYKHFYLAKEAPLCSGPLRGVFSYNAVTPTVKAILEGTYVYPPEFDEATKPILQECALIRLRIPENSVSMTITPEDWNRHWHPAWEGRLLPYPAGTLGITRQGSNLNMYHICKLYRQLSL